MNLRRLLCLLLAVFPLTQLTGPLEHWQYDTLRALWQDRYAGKSPVTFTLDAEGTVRDFRVSIRPDFVDPLEYVFERHRP